MTALEPPLFEVRLFSDKIVVAKANTDETAVFTSIWLRFNTFEKKEFDSQGWTDGSYQYNTSACATLDGSLRSVEPGESRDEIVVSWEDGSSHAYSLSWLWRTAVEPDPLGGLALRPWKNLRGFTTYDFREVMDEEDPAVLIRCLRSFFTDGVSLVTGVPPEESSIRAFAERISRIETTQFDDVMALTLKESPTNLAEVGSPVYLHNDIVFRVHPPAVQLLHVIRQADSGGENLLVDGLNVVQQLSREDRDLLRNTPVNFVNQSRGIHYRSEKPILAYDAKGTFREIHYNKDKMTFPTDIPRRFYEAYERLETLLLSPDNCDPTFRLPENVLMLMDNLRVLHGRRRFSDRRRYYLACYVCGDELKNRYRVLVEEQLSQQRGVS